MREKGTNDAKVTNRNKGFTIFIFLVAIVALGYYVHLSNKSPDHQNVTENSEKDILLNYDMEVDYPKTVRETVKLHCRYLKYIYSDEFMKNATEDDIFTMNQQMRKLFDEELLAINSPDDQLQALKDEMALYRANKQKIVSYTLAEASQIEYNTQDDAEYAKMKVTVAMTVDGASLVADQEYILRQDEEGNWKILGWQTLQNAKNEGDAK